MLWTRRSLTGALAVVAGVLGGFALARSLDSIHARPAASPAGEEPPSATLSPTAQPALEEERERWARREQELTDRIIELQRELAHRTEESLRREQEWVAFNETYTSLATSEAPRELVEAMMGVRPEEPPEEPAEPDPAELYRIERSTVIGRSLGNLLLTEGVDSFVLLEAGLLGDGFIGPVVCRMLDERGRPVGSLSADRLRLEGSRAGRTLTIILEDGYERRGGEKIPFADGEPGVVRTGTRRILLQHTDPEPWIERCAELFGPESLEPIRDDGRWHRFLVHRRLNELLASDLASGHWRVTGLGGIVDGVLRSVELENLDRNEHLVRRLVADRMTIELSDRGVLLKLLDGVQITGARKHAFLDGRFRIFLPSADREAWREAGLPGLTTAIDSDLGAQAAVPVGRR